MVISRFTLIDPLLSFFCRQRITYFVLSGQMPIHHASQQNTCSSKCSRGGFTDDVSPFRSLVFIDLTNLYSRLSYEYYGSRGLAYHKPSAVSAGHEDSDSSSTLIVPSVAIECPDGIKAEHDLSPLAMFHEL